MALELSGVKKSAILLIMLGKDASSQVLKNLSDTEIKNITYEIANIEYVRPEERELVIREFIEMTAAREYFLEGGIDYAKEVLNQALGSQRAKEVVDMLTQIQQKERPFAIARKADPKQLVNILKHEHPQTIALIMCYIQPEKAGLVLSGFPIELQTEIAERIGTISRTSPNIISKIEKTMDDKFSNIIDGDMESVGGVTTLVEILNAVDRSTEKNILSVLEESQPELAQDVKANLFIFEDIISLDRGFIQRILRDVNNDDLVLALKGSTEEVSKVIYENMSSRAAEIVKDEIKYMGPVRLVDVEEAQQKIVATIRTLDDAGEIIMSRGDQDSIII